MFSGKFVTPAEFLYLEPINIFHRESEKIGYSHPAGLQNLHIDFRGSFEIASLVPEKVIVRVTADDYYKLYVNGKFVCQGPAQGYPKGYNWNETDVSEYLVAGENQITAEVYYNGLINRSFDSGDLRCGFLLDLISKEGGKEEFLFGTDESWQCRFDRKYVGKRTTGYQTQFLEDLDLRAAPTEWERVRVKEPDYEFAKEPAPLLDVHTLEPVAFIEKAPGGDGRRSIIYDFGREVTAGLSFTVTGKDGDSVELRCAEELAPRADKSYPPEGILTPETEIRWKSRANCEYDETVILKDGENSVNQYDYKAFRYAELIIPEGVTVEFFKAVERHYPLDKNACLLETSDEVLKKVFDICKLGVTLGSQEVYVDCPGREKAQYAGDLTISSASQLWLSGDPRLFIKAVRNQVESTFIDEGIMAVTPGSYMQEIADYSLQFPILALRYYDFTGDREGLTELLGVCDRMLTYFEKWQRDDGLLDGVDGKWNLVDWPTNLRDNYDFPLTIPIGKGVHNVMNAFYIGAVICTEKIIDILGIRLEEGARRSEALIEAYNRCFWRPELGLYADSETSDHCALHSNVLPLYFGFAKSESHKNIADLIRKRGFSCGVYMAYFTLKALARLELWGDIWNMITCADENSWYNMAREGNTCCIEAWGKDKKWNTSLCHPWASAPISVLIEDIIGVSPKAPGFTDVDVRPHIPAGVEKLEMRIPLVTGRHIEFEWENGFYSYRLMK